MKFVFVQTSLFATQARNAGFTNEDHRRLENEISEKAKISPVIAGTSGIRKIRFATERMPSGKKWWRAGVFCGVGAGCAYLSDIGLSEKRKGKSLAR